MKLHIFILLFSGAVVLALVLSALWPPAPVLWWQVLIDRHYAAATEIAHGRE